MQLRKASGIRWQPISSWSASQLVTEVANWQFPYNHWHSDTGFHPIHEQGTKESNLVTKMNSFKLYYEIFHNRSLLFCCSRLKHSLLLNITDIFYRYLFGPFFSVQWVLLFVNNRFYFFLFISYLSWYARLLGSARVKSAGVSFRRGVHHLEPEHASPRNTVQGQVFDDHGPPLHRQAKILLPNSWWHRSCR